VVIGQDERMAWRSRNVSRADLSALHPGVPAWLVRPLIIWVARAMRLAPGEYSIEESYEPNIELLQEYEVATRAQKTMLGVFRKSSVPGLFEEMGQDGFLDFTDFLVFHVARLGWKAESYLDELRSLLEDSGSEWVVGIRDGHASLEKRVPEGVLVAANATIAQSASAGLLLAEAWHAAFGRSPDPEEAYEKSIKAVEEAGASIVTPNNRKTTLGTMVRDMRAQKDWRLDLPSPDADVPVKMAEALWIGQESRHGGNGYRKPTQAEAEAAVLLAVPIVQWFTSGALARRP
jgi:hypothetical protein